MKRKALSLIGTFIRKEIKEISADFKSSLFRDHSQPLMENFIWDLMWSELQEKAPLATTILQSFLPTQQKGASMKPVLCMCFAIILKRRSPKMCMIQSLLSLSLYAGNAGTQVCDKMLY